MGKTSDLEKAKEDFIRTLKVKAASKLVGISYAQLLIRLLRNAESSEEVRAIGWYV